MSFRRRGRKRKVAALMESLITEQKESAASPPCGRPMTSSSNADSAHMNLEHSVNLDCEASHKPGMNTVVKCHARKFKNFCMQRPNFYYCRE